MNSKQTQATTPKSTMHKVLIISGVILGSIVVLWIAYSLITSQITQAKAVAEAKQEISKIGNILEDYYKQYGVYPSEKEYNYHLQDWGNSIPNEAIPPELGTNSINNTSYEYRPYQKGENFYISKTTGCRYKLALVNASSFGLSGDTTDAQVWDSPDHCGS